MDDTKTVHPRSIIPKLSEGILYYIIMILDERINDQYKYFDDQPHLINQYLFLDILFL